MKWQSNIMHTYVILIPKIITASITNKQENKAEQEVTRTILFTVFMVVLNW